MKALQHQQAVLNGVPLYDTAGHIVNAHGACIVKDGGRYYLFGEYKSDEQNAFCGFSCYSSDDLLQWRFERMALPVQENGIMGKNRIGERVKVMRCPATGLYMMYFHSDNLTYTDQYTAYAVSDCINGEYELQGAVCYNGEALRYWDMGVFQDRDGTGYILEHHGDIFRLSDDYTKAVEKLPNVRDTCTDAPDADLDGLPVVGESPAMFTHNGQYFLLYSDTTSWEKNDNFYLKAPGIRGPWQRCGRFCPKGTLTHNSQTSFVLPLGEEQFLFMGDRWSYPHQASAATYVWLPMHIADGRIVPLTYASAWDIQTLQLLELTGDWQQCACTSADKAYSTTAPDDSIQVRFTGCQCAVTGTAAPDGGYARISIFCEEASVCTVLIDFYAKQAEQEGLRYLSPELPEGNYRIVIENLHESPRWKNKAGTIFGSTGTAVRVTAVHYR